MIITEPNQEQQRRLIDVQQVYDVYQEAVDRLEKSYQGNMSWNRSGGHEYLTREFWRNNRKIKRSLGVRSTETEQIKREYTKARKALQARVKSLKNRLNEMAGVNKALFINRVPSIETAILRRLHNSNLLGGPIQVVGTNALYAYERLANVFLPTAVLATADIDLLWDARQKLDIMASTDVQVDGLLGLLQKVDPSFHVVGNHGFRASNEAGYLVDLITPVRHHSAPRTLTGSATDLHAVGIDGLSWLVNAPKIETMLIGHDGLPLTMSTIDPRVFALHKLWLSRRHDRQLDHRPRDKLAAIVVGFLCKYRLNLDFDDKALSALPKELASIKLELKTLCETFDDEQTPHA